MQFMYHCLGSEDRCLWCTGNALILPQNTQGLIPHKMYLFLVIACHVFTFLTLQACISLHVSLWLQYGTSHTQD